MARKRMIDPSFWIDEKLGTVEIPVRLLFMGLISQADDEGRLNGHPALLKSLIFPYDITITPADVDNWLNLLAADDRKVIRRYEVDHQKYIFVTNFKKHQTINKPQKSKLPEPPDDYGSNTVTVSEHSGIDTAQKKLIEVKRSEEEEKGSELCDHSPFNDSIKDRIYQFAVKCEIKKLHIVSAEQELFYFIDRMDVEVIEAALTKSIGMNLGYVISILNSWEKEGKTKKEHLRPATPQRGNGNGYSLKSGKPEMKVVSGTATPAATPEEREKMRELARKLKQGKTG